MKKWFATIMALTMLCTLCACGGKEKTPFHMKLEKGDDGYTCYGFAKPENAVGQVEIPADVNGTAVQYVGSSAFKDSDVGAVTISEGIEEIGEAAFANCVVLESVSLPQSLTHIGYAAFSGCNALKQIHIPAGVIDMELWAFADCSSLKTVVIEGELDTLGREVFRDCTSLKVIYLPETLTTIHPGALNGCDALEEIHFAGTAEEFLEIDFNWDWMSAENVLVCCADENILMEDKNTWSHTDRQAQYPANPMDALFDYGDWSDPGPDETMSEDWSDPGPDETMPGGDTSEETEFVNTSKTTNAIAPYQAMAMEHDGWIYYFDENSNLCRADVNMNGIELFCEKPFGTYLDNDIDSVNIVGVSDTDVMYITGAGRSFVVDLASGQTQELVTDIQGEKVRLYGMSGDWIYYTRSHSDSKTLYRSGLSDGFDGEEALVSENLGELKDIYVTDTYLVYVLDEGMNWSLYCAPLMDLQVPIWRDGGSGDYYAIHLVGADGVTAVYYKGSSYVTRSKYYTCNLASGNTAGGSAFPASDYTYDGESERVYFFNKYLAYVKLEDFEEPSAYSNKNRYESEKSLGGWRITSAGDWLFFRQNQPGGGADYCIDNTGVTFMDLRGVT